MTDAGSVWWLKYVFHKDITNIYTKLISITKSLGHSSIIINRKGYKKVNISFILCKWTLENDHADIGVIHKRRWQIFWIFTPPSFVDTFTIKNYVVKWSFVWLPPPSTVHVVYVWLHIGKDIKTVSHVVTNFFFLIFKKKNQTTFTDHPIAFQNDFPCR